MYKNVTVISRKAKQASTAAMTSYSFIGRYAPDSPIAA